MPAGSHLRQGFLGVAALGPVHRLLLARLRHEMAGAVGAGSGSPGVLAKGGGPIHGVVAPLHGRAQFVPKGVAVGDRLRRTVPERDEIALERRALALQRPEPLRQALELLFPPADELPLISQPPAHLALGFGASGELVLDALVPTSRRCPVGCRRLELTRGLLGAHHRLGALFLRALPACR
jgi:hypothetical protein